MSDERYQIREGIKAYKEEIESHLQSIEYWADDINKVQGLVQMAMAEIEGLFDELDSEAERLEEELTEAQAQIEEAT